MAVYYMTDPPEDVDQEREAVCSNGRSKKQSGNFEIYSDKSPSNGTHPRPKRDFILKMKIIQNFLKVKRYWILVV